MTRPTVLLIHDVRREKKANKYPVKLRITYLRKQHYYNTGVDLSKEEYEEILKARPKKSLLENKYRFEVFERKAWAVINSLPEFSFNQFNLRMGQTQKSIQDIYSYFDEYINDLKKDERIGTASSYECSKNSLKTFQARAGFKDIDEEFLKKYEKWMLHQKNSITTVGIYLRNLRTIFNKAISEGLITRENYPFTKYKYVIPASRNIKKALDLEEIGKIFGYETQENTIEDFAKDMWIFSYLSNGMNIKDIAMLKNENVDGKYLKFNRAKTKRSSRASSLDIRVFLSDDALEIIRKWRNPVSADNPFLFPILKPGLTAESQFQTIHQTVKQINKYLGKICEKLNINKNVTTYFARHSYATVMKHAGASMEFISEALGHQNLSTTKSYMASFENETIKKMSLALTAFKTVKAS